MKRTPPHRVIVLFILIGIAAAGCAQARVPAAQTLDVAPAGAGAYQIDADLFCEAHKEPAKAVILLGGSEGGKAWSENLAAIRSLEAAGFCVVSLAYFGTDGLPAQLQRIPLEYFEKAFAWLAEQDKIVPNEYALIGGSRGGELALLLGSRYRQVKAVVAIAPSYVVFQGKPSDPLDALLRTEPAWTYQGESIPFVSIPLSPASVEGMMSGKQVEMHSQALEDAAAVERARIPVENTQGAILCISNLDDQIWPSTRMCNEVIERLKSRQFGFRYEQADYYGGHNACGPTCWNNVLDFLTREFGQAPANR